MLGRLPRDRNMASAVKPIWSSAQRRARRLYLQVDRSRGKRRRCADIGIEAHAATASGLQGNHDAIGAALAKHGDRDVTNEASFKSKTPLIVTTAANQTLAPGTMRVIRNIESR